MKNRLLERGKSKNGKFFCWHDWEAYTTVGKDWDLTMGARIPARCKTCDKHKDVLNIYIKEIPDHLVSDSIRYF